MKVRAGAAVAIAAGLAVTLAAGLAARRSHRRLLWNELDDAAMSRLRVVSTEVERALELTRSVSALHGAAGGFEHEQLRAFVASALTRHPELAGMDIARVVTDSERDAYEQRLAAEHPGFAIRDFGDSPRLTSAPRRESYVVVEISEPFPDSPALGLDLTSSKERLKMLRAARDSGDVALSPMLDLVYANAARGIRVAAPLLHAGPLRPDAGEWARVDGFVTSIISPQALFDHALPREADPQVSVSLWDTQDPADVLARTHAVPDPASARLRWEQDLVVGGRRWHLEVLPTASFFKSRPDRLTPIVVACGLLLTGLTAWGLDLGRAEAERVRRLVDERTRQLALASANLQGVLDAPAPIAILAADASGRVVLYNRGAAQLLGLPTAGAGLHVLDVHAGARPLSALMRETGGREEERTWRRSDGTTLPVDCSVTALDRPDGTGALFVAMDATARREEEAALRRALDAAEATNRAKSQFLARMSHELRTPLNSVIVLSGILLKNRSGRAEAPDLLLAERIRDNGVHLLALIDDILDLARVEAGRMTVALEPADVAALARGVIEQFAWDAAERGLRLDGPRAGGVVAVTDPARLRQVLVNLVGNALKFTPSGSITVRVGEDAGATVVEVSDTGVGIPADAVERVFQPFVQADDALSRRHGGSGLGLAICRSLCDLMGHRLEVNTRLGRGTTFRIVIPARAAEPVAAPEAAAGVTGAAQGGNSMAK